MQSTPLLRNRVRAAALAVVARPLPYALNLYTAPTWQLGEDHADDDHRNKAHRSEQQADTFEPIRFLDTADTRRIKRDSNREDQEGGPCQPQEPVRNSAGASELLSFQSRTSLTR